MQSAQAISSSLSVSSISSAVRIQSTVLCSISNEALSTFFDEHKILPSNNGYKQLLLPPPATLHFSTVLGTNYVDTPEFDVSKTLGLTKFHSIEFPTAPQATSINLESKLPTIGSTQEETMVKIVIAKNKLKFLDAQFSLLDIYFSNGLEDLPDVEKDVFLSTIQNNNYVFTSDEDPVKEGLLGSEFREFIFDSKFYASILEEYVRK